MSETRLHEVTAPDGTVFEVTAPVDATEEEVLAYAKRNMPKEPVAPAQDDKPSLSSGLLGKVNMAARGATPPILGALAGATVGSPAGPKGMTLGAGLGTLAVPLADAGAAAYNYLANRKEGDFLEPMQMPSQSVSNWLNKVYPAPQTTADRVVEGGANALTSAGVQVPAAMAMKGLATSHGGKNLATTMATAPKTQVAVSAPSAAASQYVGEKTESPVLSMLAGVGTAVALQKGMPAKRTLGTGIGDSKEAWRAKSQQAYKSAKDAGVIFKAESMESLQDDLLTAADQAGYFKGLHKQIKPVLKEIKTLGESRRTLEEVDKYRQLLGSAAKNGGPDDRRIASILIEKLDNYVNESNLDDFVPISGDPKKATAALNTARDAYKTTKKVEVIEEIFERARDDAGAFYTQSGLETALRRRFKSLKGNDKLWRQFNKDEQAQITKIIRGDIPQNLLRGLGKFAPKGVVSIGSGAYLGNMMGGPAGSALLMGGGYLADNAATNMGLSKIQFLDEMIRRAESTPTQGVLAPVATRGLLSSQ